MVQVIIDDWGRIDYETAWERQRQLFHELIDDTAHDEHIIMCEHDPVFTVGFHGNAGNMLADDKTLSRASAKLIRIERGGDITFHGPGQLVVYPIIDLRRHHLGVRQYVELLESVVRDTLEHYGIATTSNNEQIGVWLDWNTPRARKICAIGVKVSHGVTMHGLALNVNTDLQWFGMINPCGITDKGVTSMSRELNREISLCEVGQHLVSLLAARLHTDA